MKSGTQLFGKKNKQKINIIKLGGRDCTSPVLQTSTWRPQSSVRGAGPKTINTANTILDVIHLLDTNSV